MNERLKLENQLCFPLYVCAKEVIRRYAPLLEPYGLTYTQYIAMMVLWEHRSLTVKELGNYLFLDSGTLTPMLKKMERSGWLRRSRSNRDERVVVVSITEEGDWLQEQLVDVPTEIAQCLTLGGEEAMQLYRLLNTMIRNF
ncbi:MAG: MarR family transcriptional regulator [Rikenellaceae bacterium]|nr:MarR family transcriptional regulator [Rikenellaceae bacterium]